MNTNTVIVLLIAILLLWLAVTDKLTRLFDAYHVLTGDANVSAASAVAAVATTGATVLTIPNLPTIGTVTIH